MLQNQTLTFTKRKLRNIIIWIFFKIDKESDGVDYVGYYLKPRFGKLKNYNCIGFCWAGTNNSQGNITHWIFELQVFKPYQGYGFGGYLLTYHLLERRKEKLPIYIAVKPGGAAGKSLTSDQLKRFYQSYGFVENKPGSSCLVYRY